MIFRACAIGLAAVLLVPAATTAQGRGNGRPKEPRPAPPAAGAASTTAPSPIATPAAGLGPQFGSWLDDARTAAAGSGYTAIGFGYWRGQGARQLDAPILSVGYGLTDRLQLAATVPFYRASYQGTIARGLDDVYVSGKASLIAPASNGRFGLAVGSVVEILSFAPAGTSRVQWAVPLSVEVIGEDVRAYGSGGYFSRGALFTAGAVEWTAPSGTALTAALAHSISLADRAPGSPTAQQNLTDITLFVAHPVADMLSVYGGAGQTFFAEGRALTLSGGISIRFAAR